MADNIYHYVVQLPEGVNEAVLKCLDGYTVYTADRLDEDGTKKAYYHALRHIRNRDFEKEISVNTKEFIAHKEDYRESSANNNDYHIYCSNLDEPCSTNCF